MKKRANNALDLCGARSGKLTAIRPAGVRGGHVQWLAKCDCGNETIVRGARIKSGEVRSCGCIVGKCGPGHGYCGTPTYSTWHSMIGRCGNPNDPSYGRYGGAGVKVCARWRKFENFLADMGERPSLSHSIDRIDSKRGYTRENCRWASHVEQNNNLKSNVRLKFRGREQTLMQWSRELRLSDYAIRNRLRNGWTVERALSTPCRVRKDNVCV